MRAAITLAMLAALALSVGAEGATLNKCIDAKGGVTYSNLPCHNAREARTLEIDPEPPAPAHRQAEGGNAQAAIRSPAAAAPPSQKTVPAPAKASRKLAGGPSTRQCDALSDKLGHLLDKMDQARRSGYTQKQMDAWNLEAKEIEHKKQRAGCF